MIHFHHLLSTQLLMTAGLTQKQSHTIDGPCMGHTCRMQDAWHGSCIHPSIHLAMEGGLSLHVTYRTASLLRPARCYAPPPPPIFGQNYCIGLFDLHYTPPPAGRSSRFTVLQFLHVYVCCKCRRVVFVCQACRK